MNEPFRWTEGEDVCLETPTTSNQQLAIIARQIGQMSLERGRQEFQEAKQIILESAPMRYQWPLGVSMLMIQYNPMKEQQKLKRE